MHLYSKILKNELVPAMGCTEPIAIAFAAAKARDVLGEDIVSAKLGVSGSIVKNAKSVYVPNTNGKKGINAAFFAGIVAGKSELMLEVISHVNKEDLKKVDELIENFNLELYVPSDAAVFDIRVELFGKNGNNVYLRIKDRHTYICEIKKNGKVLFCEEDEKIKVKKSASMTLEGIYKYAETIDLNEIKDVLDTQIDYNMTISLEGMKNDYGANIGKTILKCYPNDVSIKAKAYAAAGSDARMNGCELPVIINSGSGNQGMTASIPVIIYAKEYNVDKEKLYRALLVSNLITIHVKNGIGTLSAYCGAIAAGAGAGCGIAYLLGGSIEDISHTLVNALAIDSGIICDGAKASCAAKIATAVENGILGYYMFRNGNQFYGGDGIVKKGVEKTIESVSKLAQKGMDKTDNEIIKIMLED